MEPVGNPAVLFYLSWWNPIFILLKSNLEDFEAQNTSLDVKKNTHNQQPIIYYHIVSKLYSFKISTWAPKKENPRITSRFSKFRHAKKPSHEKYSYPIPW